jgi:hypothetical protein
MGHAVHLLHVLWFKSTAAARACHTWGMRVLLWVQVLVVPRVATGRTTAAAEAAAATELGVPVQVV